MKKLILLTLFITIAVFSLIIIILSFRPLEQFNDTQKNGTIAIQVTTLPIGTPIIKVPTTFSITLKDAKGKFSFTSCDCQAIIMRKSQIVFNKSLDTPDINNYHTKFIYSFQDIGDYSLLIHGVATDGSFKAFQLKFRIPVVQKLTYDTWLIPYRTILIILGLGGILGTLETL